MKHLGVVSAVSQGNLIEFVDYGAVPADEILKKLIFQLFCAVFFSCVQPEALLGRGAGPVAGDTGADVGGIDGRTVFENLDGNRKFAFFSVSVIIGRVCFCPNIFILSSGLARQLTLDLLLSFHRSLSYSIFVSLFSFLFLSNFY